MSFCFCVINGLRQKTCRKYSFEQTFKKKFMFDNVDNQGVFKIVEKKFAIKFGDKEIIPTFAMQTRKVP